MKVFNLIRLSIRYAFPCGRAGRLYTAGLKISNSTNPLIIIKKTTLLVTDCWTPPPVRLAAHCVAAGSSIIASFITPNPVTIGSAIDFVRTLYEKC